LLHAKGGHQVGPRARTLPSPAIPPVRFVWWTSRGCATVWSTSGGAGVSPSASSRT